MEHPIENHQPFSSGMEKIIIIESYDDPYYQIIHKRGRKKNQPHLTYTKITIERKYLIEPEETQKYFSQWKFFFLSCFQCFC